MSQDTSLTPEWTYSYSDRVYKEQNVRLFDCTALYKLCNIIEAKVRRDRICPRKNEADLLFSHCVCMSTKADGWCIVMAPLDSPVSNLIHLPERWISIKGKGLSLPLWNLAAKKMKTVHNALVKKPAENLSGGGWSEDKGDDAESKI